MAIKYSIYIYYPLKVGARTQTVRIEFSWRVWGSNDWHDVESYGIPITRVSVRHFAQVRKDARLWPFTEVGSMRIAES